MKNVLTYLKQLGLSQTEAKLYITLLKSGPLTVASLAEAARINRTAAYSHINSLLEKGIIAKTKGSANRISAVSPDSLHYLIEQKEIQIDLLKEKFPSIIMALNSTISPTTPISHGEMKYYKGRNGVKKIYEEALKSEELRTYFNNKVIKKALPENEKLFLSALKRNTKIKLKEIVQNTLGSKELAMDFLRKQGTNRCFYKFLPEGVSLSTTNILIYEGTVAIIDVRNQISGVILKNQNYFESSKEIFDLLWRLLPDRK